MAYKSQNNEVEYILKYFGGFVGTLLSIGECDGVTFSNSYDFIERGWKATLVEPIKRQFDKIPVRDGVEKFNFGIGTYTGAGNFWVMDDGLLSSANRDNADRFGLAAWVEPVNMVTYADALAQFTHKHFDFITIDAEGMDWEILRQIDLQHTRCVCIEYGSNLNEIAGYCHEFRKLHGNGENLILVR